MRFVKYLLVTIAIVLLGLIITAAIGLHYLRGIPHFYKKYQWTADQRSAVSSRAENKLSAIQNLAANAFAAERKGQQTASSGDPVMVTLTEEELNAFIEHKTEIFKSFTEKYEDYFKDPGVFFHQGDVILAGQAGGYVISFYFEPRIDENGMLRLSLVKTTSGNLSVPQSFVSSQLAKLQDAIRSRLPQWQEKAKMDSAGQSNSDMVAAATAKVLLAALSNRPTPAAVFMPIDFNGKRLIPVRITNLRIDDESMTLTLAPMDAQQREKMKREILRGE